MCLGLPKRGTLARRGWTLDGDGRHVERNNLLAYLSVIEHRLDLTLKVEDASDELSAEAGEQLAQMASRYETCCLRPASKFSDVLQRDNVEFLVTVERETRGGRHNDAVGGGGGGVASQGAQDRGVYTLHCYVCRVGFEVLRRRKLPVCLDMDKTLLLCQFLGEENPRGWKIPFNHELTIDVGVRKCQRLLAQAKTELENVKSQEGPRRDERLTKKAKEIAWLEDQEILLHFYLACTHGETKFTIDGSETEILYGNGDPFVELKRVENARCESARCSNRRSCCTVLSSFKGRPYILYLRPKIADLLLDTHFDFFFSTHAHPLLAIYYLKVRR